MTEMLLDKSSVQKLKVWGCVCKEGISRIYCYGIRILLEVEYFACLPETEVLCRCVLQVTNVWALDHNL